jgi:uncharacterized protein YggE
VDRRLLPPDHSGIGRYTKNGRETRHRGARAAAPVPIASGEDTLRVRVTVAFEIAR